MLICISPLQVNAFENGTTLKEAMAMAVQSHPELKISELRTDAARGQLTEQSAYAYNPELSLEGQNRRLNGGGRATDYYLSLSQGIELGGKRDYREQTAQAGLDANIQRTELTRQQLSVGVARSFVELYFSKNVLNVRSQQRASLKDLSMAIKRRLDVGDANILDMNLANLAFVSALSAATDAQQAFTLAQSSYYRSIGKFGDEQAFEPKLSRLMTGWKVPEEPFTIALESRSDLAVLQSRLRQSHAASDLAGAGRIPDPTISLMSGREAGEQLVKLGISFPLPFWNSHKGAYRASLSDASRTESELAWFKRRLKLEVQAAVFNHKNAMQALNDAFKVEESNASLDNIKLAKIAFKAGELSLEELVVHINQTLDARLTALNMMKQGWLARIRLAEVLGHPEYILEGVQ